MAHSNKVALALVGALVLTAPAVALAEIILKAEPAKQWEKKNPGKEFKKMVGQDGKVIEIKVGWDHKGVESKPTEWRDQRAAESLFRKGEDFVKEWNNNPDNGSLVRFAGVQYTETVGGWSETTGGTLTSGRKYKCGGTAVGYVLIYP